MKMVDAITRAGTRYDLVVLPETNHGLGETSGQYLLERLRQHFVEYLKR